MAGKRAWKLDTARDIRKALAKLFNQLMRDEVDGQTARNGTYILRTLLEADERCELEDRLAELERLVNERAGK